MKTLVTLAALVLCQIGAIPERALAQTPLRGDVEVGVAAAWTGKVGLGSVDATETTPTGSASRLFSSSSVIAATPAVEGHLGIRVARRVEVEGFGSFARTTLRSSLADDVEAATPVVASEDVTQYGAGLRVLWYPSRSMIGFAPTGRVRLFIAGGAAYLRELHESSTLAGTGRAYHLVVGLKRMVTTGSKQFKGFGIGGEVGILARTRGVAFDDGIRFSPRAAVSLFSRF